MSIYKRLLKVLWNTNISSCGGGGRGRVWGGCSMVGDVKNEIPRLQETQGEKTYLLSRAPNEDSNQTVYQSKLIKVYIDHMKKFCSHSYPKCAQ